jgi:hypothetical protein
MRRFQQGDEVLVRHFMGTSYEPPRCALVSQVYAAGRSMIYDYLVQIGANVYPVRDEWLAPLAITILEDAEWADA